MRWAAKAALALGLVVVACVAAGLYGALHNQVSFGVGPAYFHEGKFPRFRIPQHLHDHRGAAIVGWRASWWMGTFLSPPLIVAAFFAPGVGTMGAAFLRGVLGTMAVTALIALGALASAAVLLHEPSGRDLAGAMHDASYLGSTLGALVGLAVTIRSVLRADRVRRVVDTSAVGI